MKAVLVVSFGTTHEDTRIKTIEAIENDIRKIDENVKVYRAWTSKIIMKRVRENLGLEVDDVQKAMERMKKEGIKKLLVQPTHIINGIENDNMIRDVRKYESYFEKIIFGKPLLTDDEDYEKTVEITAKDIFDDIKSDCKTDLSKETDEIGRAHV